MDLCGPRQSNITDAQTNKPAGSAADREECDEILEINGKPVGSGERPSSERAPTASSVQPDEGQEVRGGDLEKEDPDLELEEGLQIRKTSTETTEAHAKIVRHIQEVRTPTSIDT